MSTINENQKKLKCFYKEGKYEGKEYDTKCNYIAPISFSIKYEFDKGYLLVTQYLEDGTDFTQKYFVNGTAIIEVDNLIENWCINKNKLFRTSQDANKFHIYKSIIEKKKLTMCINFYIIIIIKMKINMFLKDISFLNVLTKM